jgi:hypothetical protein
VAASSAGASREGFLTGLFRWRGLTMISGYDDLRL